MDEDNIVDLGKARKSAYEKHKEKRKKELEQQARTTGYIDINTTISDQDKERIETATEEIKALVSDILEKRKLKLIKINRHTGEIVRGEDL